MPPSGCRPAFTSSTRIGGRSVGFAYARPDCRGLVSIMSGNAAAPSGAGPPARRRRHGGYHERVARPIFCSRNRRRSRCPGENRRGQRRARRRRRVLTVVSIDLTAGTLAVIAGLPARPFGFLQVHVAANCRRSSKANQGAATISTARSPTTSRKLCVQAKLPNQEFSHSLSTHYRRSAAIVPVQNWDAKCDRSKGDPHSRSAAETAA